jgi:hypothetical protein
VPVARGESVDASERCINCLRLQAQTAGRVQQRQGKRVRMVLVESVALEVGLHSFACEERAVENQWQNRGQKGRWWKV